MTIVGLSYQTLLDLADTQLCLGRLKSENGDDTNDLCAHQTVKSNNDDVDDGIIVAEAL